MSMNIAISIDGAVINSDCILDVQIHHSINDVAPSGYVVVKDNEGYFKQGKILAGSQVGIFDNDKKDDWVLSFFILNVEFIGNANTFYGNLKINLIHGLKLFQFAKTGAWPSTATADKIISDVIDDNKAFFFLYLIKERDIVKGEPFRHIIMRTKQRDIDFLLEKIIPYTTINDYPPLFFIDLHHKLYFTNMAILWKVKPKSLLTTAINRENTRVLQYSEQKLEIGKDGIIPIADDILFRISPNLLENFRVGFNINDESTNATSSGTTKSYIKVDPQGILPISSKFAALIGEKEITKVLDLKARPFNDLSSRLINEQITTYESLTATVSIIGYYEKFDVGQGVYLMSAMTENYSWVEDQYLIAGIDIELTQHPGVLKQTLTLIKPGVVRPNEYIDSKDLANFYQVV